MSDNYVCSYCNSSFPLVPSTCETKRVDSSLCPEEEPNPHIRTYRSSGTFQASFLLCPTCGELTIKASGIGTQVKEKEWLLKPDSTAKQFPSYIPQGIVNDYEEACKIVNLSPKASATLSRRCLQGMIRDFWSIQNKQNLYEEIIAIQDEVSPEVSRVLKGLKDLGNIGAHMERDINLIIDIDPDEAEKLIKLIEYLMKEWYINRYESEQLFNDIIGIDESKKEQKRNGKS